MAETNRYVTELSHLSSSSSSSSSSAKFRLFLIELYFLKTSSSSLPPSKPRLDRPYEKEHRVLVDALDKMKDAVNTSLVSNTTKATEAAVNASAQAIRTTHSAPAAKRKRNAQES